MSEISRRRFIQGAATAATIGAVRPAFAAPAKLSDIDHIIILMKENRSFDHYFGSLRGVRGFDDPAAEPIFRQADPQNPNGYELPFRLDTRRTNAQRLHVLSHEWGPQHAAWNGGRMDNWLPAHRAADGPYGPLTMGYMTREDLPFYYALADAFTICDGYHASVLGPTRPNRYYLMTATLDPDGKAGGPVTDNSIKPYRWETYPERLERAGISWRIYHDLDDYGCNVCRFFAQYHDLPHTSPLFEGALRNRPLYELLWDLKTGNIPQVSWIVPTSEVMEHPDFLPAAGEDNTNRILQALWSNPKLWAKTAVILNYDENDGQFDHVPPPTPEPGTAGEFINGMPVGLGYRVPCMVISPFSRGGYVCGTVFDHTSVLQLIEKRFGVEIANLSQWRRKTCGDMTAAFDFATPHFDVPRLPETGAALRVVEEQVMTLPAPIVPVAQAMPRQEPGTRPRRV